MAGTTRCCVVAVSVDAEEDGLEERDWGALPREERKNKRWDADMGGNGNPEFSNFFPD